MSERGLKRAMAKAHADGLVDGSLSQPHDPSRRGVEVGWTEYLRWAYDAGHEEGQRKMQRLRAAGAMVRAK